MLQETDFKHIGMKAEMHAARRKQKGGIRMEERQKCEQELDGAIDRMDLEAVERLLDRLDELEPSGITAEDPALFAARIRKLHKERESMMKHTGKKVILVAACLAAILSVGVYASGIWTQFDFRSGGKMVTVTTADGSMTAEEAHALAGDTAPITAEEAEKQGAIVIREEPKEFASVAEASQALGMPIALPSEIKGLELADVSGQVSETGKNFWATYGKEGRRLGVTVCLDQPVSDDMTVVSYSDIEGDVVGTYKNKAGDSFTLLRDEHGDYAVTRKGSYQYILIFEGFSEQEIHTVIDSTDLSAYH